MDGKVSLYLFIPLCDFDGCNHFQKYHRSPKMAVDLFCPYSVSVVLEPFIYKLVISVYLSSQPVARLRDTLKRRLVVTGDSVRKQA